MRHGLALAALSALAVVSVDAGARPPVRPAIPPALPPAVTGSTRDATLALRAPGQDAILVRAGTFIMGSDEIEIATALADCQREPEGEICSEGMFNVEYAPHEVYLSSYFLDRTEVTVERYRRCVAAGYCAAPPYAEGGERFDRPSYPVTLVTWQDAASYCAWVGGRLPTEAEWERGARGPSSRRYPWGNVYDPFVLNHGRLDRDALDDGDGYLELAPVASFPDGRTPDGLADMAGNVEEWVADYFAPEYPKESLVDPKGPDTGEERVVRGGSYFHGRSRVRSAAREKDVASARRPWRGFRCARDLGGLPSGVAR